MRKRCNCEETIDCGCQVKDLGTKCVIYTGEYLPEMEIFPNTNLEDILKKIEQIVIQLRQTNV